MTWAERLSADLTRRVGVPEYDNAVFAYAYAVIVEKKPHAEQLQLMAVANECHARLPWLRRQRESVRWWWFTTRVTHPWLLR